MEKYKLGGKKKVAGYADGFFLVLWRNVLENGKNAKNWMWNPFNLIIKSIACSHAKQLLTNNTHVLWTSKLTIFVYVEHCSED